MTEKELIRRCKKFDRSAQEILYKRYAPKLYSYLLHLTGNRELAKDILQETFYKAFISIKKFRQEASLNTWLRRIALNLFIDYCRAQKRFITELTASHPGADEPPEEELLQENLPEKVWDQIELTIQAEDIKHAIQQLPVGARTILLMHLEGYKHEEIAQKLGITVGTVKSQLFRARTLVRKTLTENFLLS